MNKTLFLFLSFTLFLTACAQASLAAPKQEISQEQIASASPEKLDVASPANESDAISLSSAKLTADTCPVTLPSNKLFTPPPPYPSTAPYEGQFWYGSASLWTSLPTDGKWSQLARGEKMFWWRDGFGGGSEPQPELSVSAKLLDADAPVAEFGPPATNAYHEDFHWAMLIGVDLPSTGCWEITGHYDKRELSFVVWVGE